MAAPITATPLPAVGRQLARDLLSLTKPRINLLALCTTAGGMKLAGGTLTSPQAGLTLLGTAFVVAGAATLNCYFERDIDARMKRTRNRPLPAGRLAPQVALTLGIALSAFAIPLLTFGSNPLTGLLAAVALVSYVFIYTPLKQKSSFALIVGAVPGAIPPLMGWTAVRGSLEAPGLLLFLVLFLWQVPHFLSLALVLKEDYAAAGLVTTPIARGDAASRFELVRYVFATVAVSLLPFPLRIAGGVYLVSAAVLGVVFLVLGLTGLRGRAGTKWSRAFFAASIVYLSLLFAALMIDRSAA